MSTSEKIKFVLLRTVGNFLVLFSLYGVFATFGPAISQEVRFQLIRLRGVHYTVQAVVKTPSITTTSDTSDSFGDILAGQKEKILVAKDTTFSILIPKIGASAKVFPNVDAVSPAAFLPVLQQGVAHAKGSVFPGMKGNTYLFAHSTDNWWNVGRYNAVFYLLKDLIPGDDIVIFFEGQRHNYTVRQNMVSDASDVSYLINSRWNTERLILQTCWPPGTTWKRIFVIAEPKSI